MRFMIIRLGAIGDMIGVTPLVRYLKQQGNEIYILTKATGEEILRNNPNVAKIVLYNDELKHLYPDLDDVPNEKLGDFFDAVSKTYEADQTINLCESWEVKLARCPHEPNFKFTKSWAIEHCDTNYYEQYFKIAGIEPPKDINPEMFFTDNEHLKMNNNFVDFRKKGKFVILWGLSGSAANKTYPYVPEVINSILEQYPQVSFLTVGDDVCRVLEQELKHERIFNMSGIFSLRESCLACKYANLVVAPDTGILHASGCFDTPKIGLLNHTSRNNITKHFINDYSIEAKDCQHPLFGPVSCSPCYKIHYNKKITCNTMILKHTEVPVCMGAMTPDIVIKRISEVIHG